MYKKLFILLLFTIFLTACSTNNNTEVNGEAITVSHEYEILEKSIEEGYERISLRVLVHDATTVDEQEIDSIAKKITEDLKKEMDFSALNIFFYDRIEDSDSSYTLGNAVYAPNGVWADWREAQLGEYDNFNYEIYYGSAVNNGVLPKDNPNYPTEEEFKIYAEYLKHVYVIEDTLEYSMSDKEAFDIISKDLGISYEQVKNAVYKASFR